MFKLLLQVITVFCFISCSISNKTQVSRNDRYYNHFNKIAGKNGTDLYRFDSTGYSNFIYKEDFSTLVSIVYGYFLNDTLKVPHDLLKYPNAYCKTVVLNEIKNKVSFSLDSSVAVKNDFIFTSHLINMKTHTVYNNYNHRKKLVVIYHLKNDRIFKKFYPAFLKACQENDFDLVVLSLDPLW